MTKLKYTAFMAAILIVAVACAPKPPDSAAEAAALMAGGNVWFDRYNAGDVDGVAALYAEDALVMPANSAPIHGRPALHDYLAADIGNSRAAGLTFKGNEVTDGGVDGNTAWISGTFSVNDASGATVDTGKYVSLYRRSNGQWLITRDIWNSDAPPAAGTTVVITAQVKDAAKWEEGFRTHADLFKSQTIKSPIRFATTDKNDVTIRMDVGNVDEFFRIVDSPATAEAMAFDGVKRETVKFAVLSKSFEFK